MKTQRTLAGAAVLAALTSLVPATAPGETVARMWNEQNLAAIRIDFPDPAVHSRNLFHTSAAMWDAWAAYDPTAVGYIHRETAVPPSGMTLAEARDEAISYAAHRILTHRYQHGVNGYTSLLEFDTQMVLLGYPPSLTILTGDSPAAVGQRIAATVLAFAATDGSNEENDYEDLTYTPLNDPLILERPGFATDYELMDEPNHWQPLAFASAFTQNGLEADLVQTFLGSAWGEVRPFALHRAEGEIVYHDPGPPPYLGGTMAEDAAFKSNSLDVVRYSRLLDPDEAPAFDCSPGAIGNNTLGDNDGTGHPLNPVTGLAYDTTVATLINEADFGRVVAEFWADGPSSETPPGHWNTLANEVVEHPEFEARIGGTGPILDPLEWDVKMYLALNGAVHDSAVAAWGCKRSYDYVRPISSIREMCWRGQSSDPSDTATYHPDGIPLEMGLSEVITAGPTGGPGGTIGSSEPGERHEHLAAYVGEIALYCWGGEPEPPEEPEDPQTEFTGNQWIRGIDWLPYQRDTFVTPAFAGYISGHSTFSRAAAEVLTAMTGSEFFPGGIASHTTPAGSLEFEYGPSTDVTLQWATYYDAADQAGISRLYGGIHVAPDDGPGRIVGSKCGKASWELAQKYFDGSILAEELPIRMKDLGNGDLAVEWDQYRGMFYKLQFTSGATGVNGFTDVTSPAVAEFDRAEMVIPAGAQGPQQFYRAVRLPNAP